MSLDGGHPTGKAASVSDTKEPTSKREAIAAIQRAVATVRPTGDLEIDRRNLADAVVRLTGLVVVPRVEPPYVRLPVDRPKGLEWAVPITVSARRQTPRNLARLLERLVSKRLATRAATAHELGGWGADDTIDAALRDRIACDEDPFGRSQSAISLAARGSAAFDDVVGLAESMHDGSVTNDGPAPYEAATLALFAALIVAMQKPNATLRGRVRKLLRSAKLEGEQLRLAELDRLLAVH